MEWTFLQNWQITPLRVVVELYGSTDENGCVCQAHALFLDERIYMNLEDLLRLI